MLSLHSRVDTAAETIALRKWIVVIAISMMILSIVAVAMRLLSRHIRHHKIWWDDWMCIFSLILSFGCFTAIWVSWQHGMGYQNETIADTEWPTLWRTLIAFGVMYGFNTSLNKLTLLLLYYRLLRVSFQTSRAFRVAAYIIATVVIATAILFLVTIVLVCLPIEKNWEPELPGHCINRVIPWILNSVLSIFTATAILVLPISEIWQLRLGTVEKIGVIFTLALGCAVIFITGWRLYLFFSYSALEFTQSVSQIIMWSYIEIVGGIVCACLPVSKPVLLWISNRIGITGQHGYFSRMRKPSHDEETTARTGSDLEAGRSPAEGSRPRSFPGKTLSNGLGFIKYFQPGDVTLLDTMVSNSGMRRHSP